MEDPRPLISIVICCHNRVDYLPKALDSALKQTYPNTEIVLYDDGSTDETPQLAASYRDQINYVRNENTGIAVARTKSCLHAKGDYIAFLDDDDIMPPDRLATLFQALQEHPDARFAVGDLAIIDQYGKIVRSPVIDQTAPQIFADGLEAVLWPKVPATVHTTLFRRSDGENIGWFDGSFDGAGEDKDFFCRLAEGNEIVYVPQIVSLYRRGHESLTNQPAPKVLLAQARIFGNYLGHPDLNPSLRKRVKSRLRYTLKELDQYRSDMNVELIFGHYMRLLTFGDKASVQWYRFKQLVKKILHPLT